MRQRNARVFLTIHGDDDHAFRRPGKEQRGQRHQPDGQQNHAADEQQKPAGLRNGAPAVAQVRQHVLTLGRRVYDGGHLRQQKPRHGDAGAGEIEEHHR